MKRFAVSIALVIGFSLGCTVPEDHAIHVLKAAGYTDVKLNGYAWFDCSDDDKLQSSFTATGPTGVRVQGAVCCGLVAKNCSIRLD
jgi:hypothetical protein